MKKGSTTLTLMLTVVLTLSSCVNPHYILDDTNNNNTNNGNSANEIAAVSIGGRIVIVDGSNIVITMPSGTDITALAPNITIPAGASIFPESGAVQDFTNPIIYTVTAIDGSKKDYTIRIVIATSVAKEITAFLLNGVSATTINTHDIYITMPHGTDASLLTPIITHTGVSISPSGAQNFTGNVAYTVTAEDGTTNVYTVHTTVALDDAKEVTAFTLAGTLASSITANDIYVTLPYGTEVVSLTPSITHTGISISPSGPQNFTDTVDYTVTAEDGTTTVYTVHASIALSGAKAITVFSIAGVEGSMDGTNIHITLPYGTLVTSRTPFITYTGASIDPAIGIAQDFTHPVTYTVTAANMTQQQYVVSVNVALNYAKEITAFSLAGVSASSITANDIYVTLPYGTSVNSITPSITHTGVSISPSGAQNFTGNVAYTVTAEDGTTKVYTVHTTILPSPVKEITAFSIAGFVATIDGFNITLELPFGTSVIQVPEITYTGASISPTEETEVDFTSPVTYTVTAANDTEQEYIVTVTVAPYVRIYDVDAQAFFDAVTIAGGALTDTEKEATDQLVLDLKSALIWTKMTTLYPMVGGSAASAKFNLKDPRDLDAAYRLTFYNNPTITATGVNWNGTNQYADTHLAPLSLPQNDLHYSYYSRENITSGVDMGAATYGSSYTHIWLKYSDNKMYYAINNASETATNLTINTAAHVIVSRKASNASKIYRNSSQIYSSAVNSSTPTNANFYLGALGRDTAMYYSARECALASIGLGLSDVEAAAFYNAVQAFQTTLGRQVAP